MIKTLNNSNLLLRKCNQKRTSKLTNRKECESNITETFAPLEDIILNLLKKTAQSSSSSLFIHYSETNTNSIISNQIR